MSKTIQAPSIAEQDLPVFVKKDIPAGFAIEQNLHPGITGEWMGHPNPLALIETKVFRHSNLKSNNVFYSNHFKIWKKDIDVIGKTKIEQYNFAVDFINEFLKMEETFNQ